MNIKNHNKKIKVLKLYYEGMSPTAICREHRIASSTLYYWITQYPNHDMKNKAAKSSQNGISKIQSHLKKLEAELDFLRRTVVKEMPLRQRMEIIDQEYGKESLHVQCEALDVNRATYLNHKYRGKNDEAWFKKREAEYAELIFDIYENSGHVYGSRKIAAIMRRKGKPVSDKYVRKIMAENGLHSSRSASSKDYQLVSRHLREAVHSSQEFKVDGINQVWVSDTTPILVHNHYYYVCVYLDLFSRKVVGWGIGRTNSTQLAKRTFLEAFRKRKPKSLVLHTDNGACYVSFSFNQTLAKLAVDHSYSRPHVPHDNAVAESFFGTLKREAVFLNGYPKSLRELREHITNYIERYNAERPHEHLGYVSPDEYERMSG